jgi:hypothetical protein
MADGQMELMINRAVLDPSATSGPNCDNSTDNHLVTMHHVLMLHDSGDDRGAILAAAIRPVAAALANPVVLFSGGAAPGRRCAPSAPVAAALPPQLELLSLQMLPPKMNISMIDLPDTQYNATPGSHPAPAVGSAVMLLRLRHLFAVGDGGPGSALGQPVAVDLAKLLAPHWTVTAAVEHTVDGITPLVEWERTRLQWRQAPASPGKAAPAVGASGPPDTLRRTTINPMEVRTWHITVAEP